MHKKCPLNLLGENIPKVGYSSVEIDETGIIGNGNEIYSMFGIMERISKDETF